MTRFVRFNLVGIMGFGLQLAVLLSLERAGWPVLVATLVAVEAAILHNFVWHERWTWADAGVGPRAARLARFHAATGAISLGANPALTAALAHAGAPVAVANVAAVLVCAAANFVAAHRFVFSGGRRERRDGQRRGRGGAETSITSAGLCSFACSALQRLCVPRSLPGSI